MTARAIAVAAAAVLAASAIAHATGGGGGGGPTIVAVGGAPGAVATGFTVAAGRVVTVAHVLDGPTVAVRGPDGVARRGTVLRRDDGLDLALLAVPGLRSAAAVPTAGTRVLVRRRDSVVALPATVTRRIDARVRQADGRRVGRRRAFEIVARTGAGDSGAPVLEDGRITGVVFARSSRRAGVAYAVDVSELTR